jgi:hypothetical protein
MMSSMRCRARRGRPAGVTVAAVGNGVEQPAVRRLLAGGDGKGRKHRARIGERILSRRPRRCAASFMATIRWALFTAWVTTSASSGGASCAVTAS